MLRRAGRARSGPAEQPYGVGARPRVALPCHAPCLAMRLKYQTTFQTVFDIVRHGGTDTGAFELCRT